MSDIGNLQAVTADGDPDSLPGKVSRSARMLIENGTDDSPLVGFITIGVFGNGCYSCGFQCPEDHLIGPTLFTAYVKEVVARELTGVMAADDYTQEYLT